MEPHRWQQVSRIFEKARDLEENQCQNYLDETCAGDPDLRREVVSLLEANTGGLGFLDKNLFETTIPPNTILGAYRIVKSLGYGGMGMVYLAEQTNGVTRKVAIKLIAGLALSGEGRQRFELEQNLMARMTHSYIARLYEVGTVAGRPYFAMEYIDGQPITTFCDRFRLTIPQRLDLFGKVCAAVSHAHLKGIVHRDIKPSNVLVVRENGVPVPKIIDFGIAKSLGEGGLTQTGQTPGTFRYMSPEQAGITDAMGRYCEVDFRTDVYALGVLLYVLLLGEPPLSWSPETPSAIIYADICQTIPKKPGDLWREMLKEKREEFALARGVSTRELGHQLGRDLDWIVMKALEKDRERRYRSPDALSKDITAFRAGKPIEAGPPHLTYVMAKVARRHWLPLSTLTGMFVLILIFSLLLVQKNRTITQERDLAQREAITLKQVTDFMVEMFEEANPTGAASTRGADNPLTVREVLDRARTNLATDLQDQQEVRARLMTTFARLYGSLGQSEDAQFLYEEALKIRQTLFGDHHIEVEETLHQLARVHIQLGKYQQAEVLLRQIIDRRNGDERREETMALYLSTLAELHINKGEYQLALPLAEKVRTILKRLEDPAGYALIRSYNNLGRIQSGTRQWQRAIFNFEKTLDLLEELRGEDHLQLTDALNNLAYVYIQQKDYESAEPLLLRALAIDRRVMGERHINVALDIHMLAKMYAGMGQVSKAESFFNEAIAMKRDLLGACHPMLAGALFNLALLLEEQDRVGEAIPLMRESLAIRFEVFGEGHIKMAYATRFLADLLNQKELFHEAEILADKACQILSESLSPEHPHYLFSLSTHGRALTGLGKYLEAETLLLKSWRGLEEHSQLTPQMRQVVLEAMITLYQEWNQTDKLDFYQSYLNETNQVLVGQ